MATITSGTGQLALPCAAQMAIHPAICKQRCGQTMADVAPSFRLRRDGAGMRSHVGEFLARFVARLLSTVYVELLLPLSGRTPSRPAISSCGDM
ncbi:hypothetical protein [Novosphingobium sp. PASSN1]|uniref:hypothetical protein n=1 Tax=Novosphingobium sp. PASSN1 TaxID=2015561 RepID=UPI000BD68BFE|nr:hypothetical protein [Novosphingobium sp. PASSN1]OYU35963.1 MAG: hypothetical protein CFE35_06720 [Novosphingobium sp. PASSN1]